MAFTQKSKFTSSGLMSRMPNKAKLINNSKTAFHQELPEGFVAEEYETFQGEQVPTKGYVETTKNFKGSRPYEDVYDEFEDTVTGGKINSRTGTVYSNIEEFIADADKSRTSKVYYEGDVDVVAGTPDIEVITDREVIPDKFKGLYNFQRRLREGIIKGGPDAWFKRLADKGIDPKSEEFRNYMQTRKDFATKRKEKEEEKKNRAEYCKRNPDKCRPSGEKEVIRTRTEGTPPTETYTGLRRVN